VSGRVLVAAWSAVVAAGGCAAAEPSSPPGPAPGRSLVLPGPQLCARGYADPSSPEYSRNDAPRRETPAAFGGEWAEYRLRDRQGTTDGRPHEHTAALMRAVRLTVIR
jgi:hypothetical protein